MTFVVRRPLWALLAFTLALAACGSSKPPRMTLHTPGVKTGSSDGTFPLASPTPVATPTPTPKPTGKPVTATEKRIIQHWSDALRRGHVNEASGYFDVPSVVSNGDTPATLANEADVRLFNATLACGAKLVKTRRDQKDYVIGTFELTDRPGGDCGTGTGQLAEVAFLIAHDRINQWIRRRCRRRRTPGLLDRRAVEALAARDGLEAVDQLRQAALLEDDPVGAGIEHELQLGGIGGRREDDDPGVALVIGEPLDQRVAASLGGQVQVHHRDVGGGGGHELEARLGRAGGAGHVPTEAGEHVAEEHPQGGMVLDDRHASRH
jgi:hypothetical protein